MKLFMKRNRRVLVFTTVVMLFLVGVGVIQLVVNQYRPLKDTAVVKVEDNKDKDTDKEDPQAPAEKMVKPVGDDIKIVKKFYDSSLSDEELEKALVYFEGVYRPNLGIDFSKDNKAFEVTAAFSGTVTKKDNDALLGWIVSLVTVTIQPNSVTNETGVSATYQSLSEVNVEKDAVIKQGDKIGTSGENVYESELKNHLHFILEKDNQALNPEKYFNQEVSKIAV